MANGTIKFESKSSELFQCSCGNDVMASGFDRLEGIQCENPHYQCNRCETYACVDFDFHIVNNITAEQAGAMAVAR